MKQDIEVLESLVSGVDMGINACDEVIKNVEDEKLKIILIDHERAYKDLKNEAETLLKNYQRDKENKHVLETAMLKSMVKMKTMMNNDDHKIAKMLIEGSNQAIISMQTLINDYPTINSETKALCEQFLCLSKEHINQWKDFL